MPARQRLPKPASIKITDAEIACINPLIIDTISFIVEDEDLSGSQKNYRLRHLRKVYDTLNGKKTDLDGHLMLHTIKQLIEDELDASYELDTEMNISFQLPTQALLLSVLTKIQTYFSDIHLKVVKK